MGPEERGAHAGDARTRQDDGKGETKGQGADGAEFAGPSEDGFLLPNGWRLTPVGKQTVLSDLPLNIAPLADNRHALVATSGYNTHHLTLVDLETGEKINQVAQRDTWFGLALDEKSGNLWWSGGGGGTVHRYHLAGNSFEGIQPALLGLTTPPAPPQQPAAQPAPASAPPAKPATPPAPAPQPDFITGVYHDPATATLYALTIRRRQNVPVPPDVNHRRESDGLISAIPLDGSPARSAPCGVRPYDVLRGRNGLLYVSDWADRRVLVVDPETLRTIQKIQVGEHPNQLALHPTDDRLLVACASSNQVAVIDTAGGTVEEVIHTALFPQAPEGSTPDALCVAPDGKRLYIANADNNCIAVVDVAARHRSAVAGFIPTGWYPTAVAITPDGKRLLVGVGKGLHTSPNKPNEEKMQALPPRGPDGYREIPFTYIGNTLSARCRSSICPRRTMKMRRTRTTMRRRTRTK